MRREAEFVWKMGGNQTGLLYNLGGVTLVVSLPTTLDLVSKSLVGATTTSQLFAA